MTAPVLSLSLIIAISIIYHIKERVSGFKHQQFVAGLKIYIYWIVANIFELTLDLVSICFIIILFFCLNTEGFNDPTQLGKQLLYFQKIYF